MYSIPFMLIYYALQRVGQRTVLNVCYRKNFTKENDIIFYFIFTRPFGFRGVISGPIYLYHLKNVFFPILVFTNILATSQRFTLVKLDFSFNLVSFKFSATRYYLLQQKKNPARFGTLIIVIYIYINDEEIIFSLNTTEQYCLSLVFRQKKKKIQYSLVIIHNIICNTNSRILRF